MYAVSPGAAAYNSEQWDIYVHVMLTSWEGWWWWGVDWTESTAGNNSQVSIYTYIQLRGVCVYAGVYIHVHKLRLIDCCMIIRSSETLRLLIPYPYILYTYRIYSYCKANKVMYTKIYTLLMQGAIYVSACMLCVVKSSSCSRVYICYGDKR